MNLNSGDALSLSRPAAPRLSPLGQAALDYARRGWPVFPCRERTETITAANGTQRTLKAKAPYAGSGVKDATTDEEIIKGWWRRWPQAMIGLAMGRNGLFALDFDPRVDAETGEIFELAGLKAALEEQMGCALPQSLTAMTQSEGVHVYLRQPDAGEPIRNRGNLPLHVDVRGLGGYVIAPPSILYHDDGREGRYRWLTNRHDDPVEAPPPLIEILRSKGKKAGGAAKADNGQDRPPPSRKSSGDDAVDAARRKWALSALDGAIEELTKARQGERGQTLNRVGFRMGQIVGAGAISRAVVLAGLEDGANASGLTGVDGIELVRANAARAVGDGEGQPRDMSDVGVNAGRSARSSSASRPSSPGPSFDEYGEPRSRGGGQGTKEPERGAREAAGPDLTLKCARLPMTDLGNLERFMERHGRDFLCVAAWADSSASPGYVAWDGRRWSRKLADALFGLAAQATVRAIQDEADFIRESGVPFPPEEGDLPARDEEANPDEEAAEADNPTAAEKLFEKAEQKRKARRSTMWYLQRSLARKTRHDGPRHDFIVQVKSNGEIVLYSDKLAAWGRTSEGSGHIECLRKLAPPRLSAVPEAFDADPLALNVQNGTLFFQRPEDGKPARVTLRPHRREDRITKIGRADYVEGAECPQFEEFLAKVQPADDMRDWLTRWAGYNALGDPDAQVMALFYGEGSNGKGVWVQTHAHILGDYAWATGIETFMDSGFKRPGAGPSPHLAALAGRRMVYANEPDDNSKFSDGLVKALTSDEPIGGVRELYGPAFEMQITFTNTVMANNLPRLGTDWGIRRRVQVVPWNVIIPKEEQDRRLKDKLRAEMSGILNRMIAGALAYLDEGLTMPDVMIEATKAYHDDNDLLGQFLALCVARSPGDTVGSTALHELFAAWQTWSENLPQTGKPWSAKKLRAEMERKSFRINKSSTMKWFDIGLRFTVSDFVDANGKPETRDLPAPMHGDKVSAALPAGSQPDDAPQTVAPSPLPAPNLDDDDDWTPEF